MVDLLSGERFIHRIPEQERTTEPHTFGPRFMAGSRIRTNPGVFARLRSFAFNILKTNRTGTLAQDRYRAALAGLDNLLSLLAISKR